MGGRVRAGLERRPGTRRRKMVGFMDLTFKGISLRTSFLSLSCKILQFCISLDGFRIFFDV